MKPSKPLLWHHGLFLQPQHMQYQDAYQRQLVTTLSERTRPFFNGLVTLDVNIEALQAGSFECERLEAVMADGTYVSFPDNAVLSPRNFETLWEDRRENLPVYLGLRRLAGQGGNVTNVQHEQDLAQVRTRFASPAQGESFEDLYQNSGATALRQLDYVLNLYFGDEIEGLDDVVLLPLSEITQQGREFRLSDQFIPPCINIGASGVIANLLQTLKNNLIGRSRILESYKSATLYDQGGLSGSALNNRLALLTLARYIPMLNHIGGLDAVHPVEVYGVLRQLAGELSTFSDRFNISSEEGEDSLSLPAYDHNRLSQCFATAIETIGHLLNELTLGPEMLVSLKREEPHKFVGALSKEFFERKHSVYLLVRTREPFRDLLDPFLNFSKLGAVGQVDVYARRSLPGVGLIHLQGKPIGVTGQPNTQYFMVERDGYEWGYVQDSGQLGLIWPDAPEDLHVDIVLVRG